MSAAADPSAMHPAGCDYSHIALSYVVPLYFNQSDAALAIELLRRYARYAPALLDRLQFVLVDDGSPVPLVVPQDLDLNLLLLRVNEDRPWNQGGARNLGMVYARSDKVVLTDIDHEFPEATLAGLLAMRNPGRRIYKFRRQDADGSPRKIAPNILLLSRGRFLELYGYDEEFCGAYGYEDLWFLRWQRYHGSRVRHLPAQYFVRALRLDRERAYHSLQRDPSRNAALYRRKRAACEACGPDAGHSRQFLRSQWQVVLDRSRQVPMPAVQAQPFWPLAWRWNKLISRL